MSYRVIQGDCVEGMKTLPDECVHTVITSPPYYGLRDYGTASWEGGDSECNHTISMDTKWNDPKRGTSVLRPEVAHRGGSANTCHKCGATRIDQQIGLEETPDQYVSRLVEVFREVRRILRKDGTLWLNLGDSYAGHNSRASNNGRAGYGNPREGIVTRISEGLKPKDLIGIPWRVAFALQADGWWLRQDIIWHKPNPMPESVNDRCTKSHEYIFLLSKSKDYYYDNVAIHEPIKDVSALRMLRGVSDNHKHIDGAPGQTPHSMNQPRLNVRKQFDNTMGGGGTSFIGHSGYKKADGTIMIKETRNKRSVWTVTTKPYADAHFAVFPPKLIEPCVLAGTSEYGCCNDCGAPRERVTGRSCAKCNAFIPNQGKECPACKFANKEWKDNRVNNSSLRAGESDTVGSLVARKTDLTPTSIENGWKPTCTCETNLTKPCVVFDPFTGSGTTALVAMEHNRHFIGTELNPEYVALIEKRLSAVQPRLL